MRFLIMLNIASTLEVGKLKLSKNLKLDNLKENSRNLQFEYASYHHHFINFSCCCSFIQCPCSHQWFCRANYQKCSTPNEDKHKNGFETGKNYITYSISTFLISSQTVDTIK